MTSISLNYTNKWNASQDHTRYGWETAGEWPRKIVMAWKSIGKRPSVSLAIYHWPNKIHQYTNVCARAYVCVSAPIDCDSSFEHSIYIPDQLLRHIVNLYFIEFCICGHSNSVRIDQYGSVHNTYAYTHSAYGESTQLHKVLTVKREKAQQY